MNSAAPTMGTARTGSRCMPTKSPKVMYMPIIRNSPCAKLTTSIRPKMSDRPAAIRAYMSPISRPLTSTCAIACAFMGLRPASSAHGPDRLGHGHGGREHGGEVLGLELLQHRAGEGVLA